MDEGNDHELKKLLIVRQILLLGNFGKFIENSTENMHTDVRDCKGCRVNTVQDVCSELLFALSQHGLTGQHQGFV